MWLSSWWCSELKQVDHSACVLGKLGAWSLADSWMWSTTTCFSAIIRRTGEDPKNPYYNQFRSGPSNVCIDQQWPAVCSIDKIDMAYEWGTWQDWHEMIPQPRQINSMSRACGKYSSFMHCRLLPDVFSSLCVSKQTAAEDTGLLSNYLSAIFEGKEECALGVELTCCLQQCTALGNIYCLLNCLAFKNAALWDPCNITHAHAWMKIDF